jgi:hypothetical protein
LFVTYFVHNVAATVSYGRKELLDIRTVITHLEMDKYYYHLFLRVGQEGYTPNTRAGPPPRHSYEKETDFAEGDRGAL